MTTTSYAFADPRAMSVWGTELFEEALSNARLTVLMGDNKDSIIYMKEDLKTQQGGTIILKIGNRLTGGGQGDDGNTTGSEQQLTKGNMSLAVHERCTAALSAGMMSEQLTDIKGVDGFRQDAKEELSVLLEEWIENDLVTCASGCYNENSGGSAIQTINESYPSGTARAWFGGQTITSSPALANSGVSFATDALLTADTAASNRFGTLVIDKVRNLALAASPRFRPGIFRQVAASAERDVRFPLQGRKIGNMFVILASPDQIATMKAEVGNNAWANMTAQCAARGNDHPVFTGATVLWNGCIVVEYDRILQRTGAGGTTLAEGFSLNAGRTATDDAVANARTVHRGLLLGAQSLCFGWAMTPGWFEDYVDCNHLKVKMDMIYGVAKTQFNAHGGSTPGNEYSTFVFDTQQ